MWRKDSLISVCILCLRLRYSWIFQLGFTCLVGWLPACFRLGQYFALHVFCCHSRLLLIFFCLWLNAIGLGMLRRLKSLESQSLFSIPGKEFFDFGESRLATALSIVSGTILLLLCTCYQSIACLLHHGCGPHMLLVTVCMHMLQLSHVVRNVVFMFPRLIYILAVTV